MRGCIVRGSDDRPMSSVASLEPAKSCGSVLTWAPDFRGGRKIFATLGYPRRDGVSFALTAEQQDSSCVLSPNRSWPVKVDGAGQAPRMVRLHRHGNRRARGLLINGMAQCAPQRGEARSWRSSAR